MKKWIHASEKIQADTSFDDWYYGLDDEEMDKVDDLADEMGLPVYDECSDAELAQLHDAFVSANDAEDKMPIEDVVYDAEYEEGLLDIESDVIDELGLYIDFSSVRGSNGPIWIFSDPEHENNADMWMGDTDEALVRMNYSEYAQGLLDNVINHPKDEWKDRYTKYLQSIIEE